MKNIHFGNIKQITKLFTLVSFWKKGKKGNRMTTFILQKKWIMNVISKRIQIFERIYIHLFISLLIICQQFYQKVYLIEYSTSLYFFVWYNCREKMAACRRQSFVFITRIKFSILVLSRIERLVNFRVVTVHHHLHKTSWIISVTQSIVNILLLKFNKYFISLNLFFCHRITVVV